jgi:hypothetical protein
MGGDGTSGGRHRNVRSASLVCVLCWKRRQR